MPLLMFLNKGEADYVLRDLHEGICKIHAVGTSLTLKALKNKYFWLTKKADTLDLVRRCDKCQRHAHVPRKPLVEQIPLTITWPFDQWEIDLLGPFYVAPSQLKYIVMAIEYFTKWIKAELLVTTNGRNV